MSPTILFVPGVWEGPTPFGHVASLLEAEGYSTQVAELLSTGHISPGNPSIYDDIAHIRATVKELVEAEKDVVLALHSAGGTIGSAAIEGLGSKARKAAGLKGGVIKIVFLAAAVAPEGLEPESLPFFDVQGGAMYCKDPEKLLFSDLDEVETQKWVKTLKPQPSTGWAGMVSYCGWREVPSLYLVCEKDMLLPAELQMQFAALAGSEVVKCGAGHMVQLSMPEKVVEVVKKAAGEP